MNINFLNKISGFSLEGGRRDPGTSTRIRKSQCLPTFKLNIKKFTSSVIFCPATLLLVPPYLKTYEPPEYALTNEIKKYYNVQ